jgi:hypothetical protein
VSDTNSVCDPAVLLARLWLMMLSATVRVPPGELEMPPPLASSWPRSSTTAVLELTVQLLIVSVPPMTIPPPPRDEPCVIVR